jgi:ABC-type transport system substrate-binding protein
MRRQRRRPLHLAAVSLAFALVIAACGGGGGGGGNGSSGTAIKDGGTLSYAADQEPTGFNNNTSKDNGTSVLNVVSNMFPPVFRLHPDYSVKLNTELMDDSGRNRKTTESRWALGPQYLSLRASVRLWPWSQPATR